MVKPGILQEKDPDSVVCDSHKRMQPVIKKIRFDLFFNPHTTGKLRVTLSGVDKTYRTRFNRAWCKRHLRKIK
jgi:hypothetical protein